MYMYASIYIYIYIPQINMLSYLELFLFNCSTKMYENVCHVKLLSEGELLHGLASSAYELMIN